MHRPAGVAAGTTPIRRHSRIQSDTVCFGRFQSEARVSWLGMVRPSVSLVTGRLTAFGPWILSAVTFARLEIGNMALKRMDNVGIVVEDLGGTIDFFRELGLELEGRATIEGEWAGRVTGLGDQRVEIAMMRTPDGHSRLELSRFLTPPVVADHRNAPVNALGYLRVMFAVDDIDETLERLRTRGAQLVGEVVQYKDAYRLCYIRGPEGLLIGLAQELS